MKQTQQQIEKLKTIQESLDFYADVAENQLPSLAEKIDNIKLPEIDTSELAKQGENAEATNSKILEEVQNKLTPLEAVLTELNNGKKEMVDAIESKGVHASTDYTLGRLAEIVKSINFVGFDTSGAEFINGLIPKSLSELLANKDGITKMEDSTTTDLTVAGGLSGLSNLESVAFENCVTVAENQFANCSKLKKVSLPKVQQLIGDSIFTGCTELQEIDLSECTIIKKIKRANWNTPFIKDCVNLSRLNLNSLIEVTGIFISGNNNLQNIRLNISKLDNMSDDNRVNTTHFLSNSLLTLELPHLSSIGSNDKYNNIVSSTSLTRLMVGNLSIINAIAPNLLDIEIGDGITVNMTFRWSPSAAYSNEEKASILNDNIRNHIIAKLPDMSGKTPLTITFYNQSSNTPNSSLVNILEQETMAAFAAKNWNVSPAK